MKEEWRDIKGYEGKYKISNKGRVMSLYKKNTPYKGAYRSKIMIPQIAWKYYCVDLLKNGKRRKSLIHRLVADAFIPNPENLLFVNHKDENKLNNNVSNLEWCTKEYNINYGSRNKVASIKLSKPVVQMNLNGEFIALHPSLKIAGLKTNTSPSSISNVCSGRRSKANGFKWKYYEETN